MDEVAENSDQLMERYLEGEEIDHDEIVRVLKQGVTAGRIFPVTCGVATRNLGTGRLLEALVEDLPSPAMRGAVAASGPGGEALEIEPDEDGPLVAYVFKTLADPYTGRVNLFRVYRGTCSSDSHAVNVSRGQKERIGQLGQPLGAQLKPAAELGAGDIGAVAKLKETRAGDVLCERPGGGRLRPARPAQSGDGVRLRAEVEGGRGEGRGGGAPPHRGGPDPRRAPRRADRGADHRRPDPGPRRGDRRPDEAPLRGRDRAAPAARPLPGVDPPARARPTPATRSSRAGGASSPTAGSRSSRPRTASGSISSTRSRAPRFPAASSRRWRRGSKKRWRTAPSPATR